MGGPLFSEVLPRQANRRGTLRGARFAASVLLEGLRGSVLINGGLDSLRRRDFRVPLPTLGSETLLNLIRRGTFTEHGEFRYRITSNEGCTIYRNNLMAERRED